MKPDTTEFKAPEFSKPDNAVSYEVKSKVKKDIKLLNSNDLMIIISMCESELNKRRAI